MSDDSVFLATAQAAAARCGVNRLADITGLDRIGFPVWQAVRPMGKSLSVHQGKGATPLTAKISALCEGIEAHCAENAPADGPLCPWPALAPEQRAEIGDFCKERGKPPPEMESIQWCEARDLRSEAVGYLPHSLVSLDYTVDVPSPFERVSGGLGAGPTEQHALRTSLLEIVERDAVGEWERGSERLRIATSLDLDTVPFSWFRDWRERLTELGVDLHAFEIPSLVRVPVFVCLIGAREEFGRAYRQFSGTAADAVPEAALFKALAEALQSRLTLIAGVRDDILPRYYLAQVAARQPQARLPKGARKWSGDAVVDGSPCTIAERLAALGYEAILVKRLDTGLDGMAVTRVFVPGLGSLTRTRRAAP